METWRHEQIIIWILLLFNAFFYTAPIFAQQEPSNGTANRIELKRKAFEHLQKVTVKITADNGLVNGSGVIVGYSTTGNALILTAAHVISSNYDPSDLTTLNFYTDLQVQVANDDTFIAASIVDKRYVNQPNDLALITTNDPPDTEDIISYLKPEKVRENLNVTAIGFPEASAEDEMTITGGAINRFQDQFIIANPEINSGNSGGAIVDKAGCVMGIVTQYDEDEDIAISLNIDFVEPVVRRWLDDLGIANRWGICKGLRWWHYVAGTAVIVGGGYVICRANDGCPPPSDPIFGSPLPPTDIIINQ